MDEEECSYCTNCGQIFDEGGLERILEHQNLSVPICGPCYDAIDKKVQKAQHDNDRCLWCGEGGNLFICDSCDHSICDTCINYHLPAGACKAIESADSWKCFSCDASPIQHLSDKLNIQNILDYFPEDLESAISLLGLVEDEIKLCEDMNEPERWAEFAATVRAEAEQEEGVRSEQDIKEELNTLKERWQRHGKRMEHRTAELQEHLEKLGGNLCAFYRFRDVVLNEGEANSSGADIEALAADSNSQMAEIGSSGWYIKDLLGKQKEMPAAMVPQVFCHEDDEESGYLMEEPTEENGSASISESDGDSESSDEEMSKRSENDVSRLAVLAEQDECIQQYTTAVEDVPPDTFPHKFHRSVPPIVLQALLHVPYGSDDHKYIINTYGISYPMEVVMKYATLSFDDGWKNVQWPSLVGFVHPSVIRALYNGDEYEVGALAGHFGVPASIDCVEDTGELNRLRELQVEYQSVRGKKGSSVSLGFGAPSAAYMQCVVDEEDADRKKRRKSGKKKSAALRYCDDELDEVEVKTGRVGRPKGSKNSPRAAGSERSSYVDDIKKKANVTSSSNRTSGDNIIGTKRKNRADETATDNTDSNVAGALKSKTSSNVDSSEVIDLMDSSDEDSDDDTSVDALNTSIRSNDSMTKSTTVTTNKTEFSSSSRCDAQAQQGGSKHKSRDAWNGIFGRSPSKATSSELSHAKKKSRTDGWVVDVNIDDSASVPSRHSAPSAISLRTSTPTPGFVMNEKSEVSKLGVSIEMHPRFSDRLMEHQKEAVRFLWKNVMSGVLSHQARLMKQAEKERIKKEKALANIEQSEEPPDSYNDDEASQESNFQGGSGNGETTRSGDIRDLLANQSKRSEKMTQKAATGAGCVIAHCMGSGKSLTTVSFVTTLLTDSHLKDIKNPDNVSLPLIHRVLIVCPVNVISNWSIEFGKWTPPALMRKICRYSIDSSVKPADRYSELMKWYKTGGVLITGKDLFCRMVEAADRDIAAETELLARENAADFPPNSTPMGSKISGNVLTSEKAIIIKKAKLARNAKKYLIDPGPDIVVLDEAHYLKNVTSSIFTIIDSIRTKRRIALTGSPMQNNLRELWSMIEFVKKGHLNSYRHFERTFKYPIEAGGMKDATPYQRRQMKFKSHVLYKKLAPIVQRRGMDQLKSDLKRKREFAISVHLTPFQKYLYKRCIRGILCERKGLLFKAVKRGNRVWNHPACLPLNRAADRAASSQSSTQKMKQISTSLLPAYKAFQAGFEIDLDVEPADMSDKDEENSTKKSDDSVPLAPPYHPSSNPPIHGVENESTDGGRSADAELLGDGNPLPANPDDPFDSLFENPEMLDEFKDAEDVDDWWTQFPDEVVNPSNTIDMTSTVGDLSTESFVGLGSKVIMFLSILSKSIEVGDKLVLFSQSLVTLDFLELILNSNWGEMLVNGLDSSEYGAYTLGSVGGNLGNSLKNRSSWKSGTHYMRLDGSTAGAKRQEMIESFTNSVICPLFLISTMAGNMGINLQCANRVIIFDASWNPASDLQAIFRCYRYGQRKCVYVYRLLAAGTVEEKMYKKQVTKMSVSARVVDAQMPDSHYTSKEMTAQIIQYQSEYESENDDSDSDIESDSEEVVEVSLSMTPEEDSNGAKLTAERPRKRRTPYEKVARVVKNDIVLSETCKYMKGQVQRVVDMDPLLMDIEEEHLNDTEKIEAEREFEQETSRPQYPPHYAELLMNISGGGVWPSGGAFPGGPLPPERRPSLSSQELPIAPGSLPGAYRAGSPISSQSANPTAFLSASIPPGIAPQGGLPIGINTSALNSPIVDYILKSFNDRNQLSQHQQLVQSQQQQTSNAAGKSSLGVGIADRRSSPSAIITDKDAATSSVQVDQSFVAKNTSTSSSS